MSFAEKFKSSLGELVYLVRGKTLTGMPDIIFW
jgi:hypothetical protein